jgi:hypothetical protein
MSEFGLGEYHSKPQHSTLLKAMLKPRIGSSGPCSILAKKPRRVTTARAATPVEGDKVARAKRRAANNMMMVMVDDGTSERRRLGGRGEEGRENEEKQHDPKAGLKWRLLGTCVSFSFLPFLAGCFCYCYLVLGERCLLSLLLLLLLVRYLLVYYG